MCSAASRFAKATMRSSSGPGTSATASGRRHPGADSQPGLLGQMVGTARRRGITRVLLVCQDDNAASAATIERNGGTLKSIHETAHGEVRRY